MLEVSPRVAFVRWSLAALLAAVALGAAAPAEAGRHVGVEARVQALIDAVERLRRTPPAERMPRLEKLVARAIDLEAWLGDAVPDLEALSPADRRLLLDRSLALLVGRAAERLDAGIGFRVEIDKTRRDARGWVVDCLVRTDRATYEIGLRWSRGRDPRLRDVMVEGVSIGAADRRRVRAAWDRGGLPETLAALDRAIGRVRRVSGPPAVATRTTPGGPAPAGTPPPPAGRPPGL